MNINKINTKALKHEGTQRGEHQSFLRETLCFRVFVASS